MKIDIISYSDKQLALLTDDQVQQVQSAQMKKNRLLRELADKLQQEKRKLINNGLFLSYTWEWTKAYWEKVYEEEIGWVQEGLLFYLHYAQGFIEGEAPYELDFSLAVTDRYAVVKNYYMETYSNAQERYDAFEKDKIAPKYLCETYNTLYDYLAELVKVSN